MRVLLALCASLILLAQAAMAAEPEQPEQRLVEMKIYNGEQLQLETMLVALVGQTVKLSSIPDPDSRSGGLYMLIASDFDSVIARPEGDDWDSLPDRAKGTPCILSCGGLYFSLYLSEGSRVELSVRETGPVVVIGENVQGAENIVQHPPQLGALNAPLR